MLDHYHAPDLWWQAPMPVRSSRRRSLRRGDEFVIKLGSQLVLDGTIFKMLERRRLNGQWMIFYGFNGIVYVEYPRNCYPVPNQSAAS